MKNTGTTYVELAVLFPSSLAYSGLVIDKTNNCLTDFDYTTEY